MRSDVQSARKNNERHLIWLWRRSNHSGSIALALLAYKYRA